MKLLEVNQEVQDGELPHFLLWWDMGWQMHMTCKVWSDSTIKIPQAFISGLSTGIKAPHKKALKLMVMCSKSGLKRLHYYPTIE